MMQNVLDSKLAKVTVAGAIATMAMVPVMAVSADDGNQTGTNDVDVEINSGGLHLETPSVNDFGDVTLKTEPTEYNTSFGNEFTTKDLRGSQDGWNLTVSATQFDNGSHQLPEGSLTLDGVASIDRVGDGEGDDPTSELTKKSVIDDGAVLVANADEGAGMGVFSTAFSGDALGLTVDATTAKTGQYTSTLTWTLANTPTN